MTCGRSFSGCHLFDDRYGYDLNCYYICGIFHDRCPTGRIFSNISTSPGKGTHGGQHNGVGTPRSAVPATDARAGRRSSKLRPLLGLCRCFRDVHHQQSRPGKRWPDLQRKDHSVQQLFILSFLPY